MSIHNLQAKSRFHASLAEAGASRLGHRGDLYLADYRMAGPEMATLSISFGRGLSAPSPEEIQAYITQTLSGKLMPVMASARMHQNARCITVNVVKHRVSERIEALNRMAFIGGNRYVDAGTGSTWEVEENDGVQALYRVSKEDMETILRQRYSLAPMAQKQASLTDILGSGNAMVIPGAQASFWNSTGEQSVGKIMAEANEGGFCPVLVTGTSAPIQVHQNMLIETMTTADLDESTKAKLQRYWEEALGDVEYARKLVREAQAQGTREALCAFLTAGGVCDIKTALAFCDSLRSVPGTVKTVGPNDMIIGMYHGNGYTWQLDREKAEAAFEAAQNSGK